MNTSTETNKGMYYRTVKVVIKSITPISDYDIDTLERQFTKAIEKFSINVDSVEWDE